MPGNTTIVLAQPGALSLRGGGVLGSFMRYVLLPIVVGVLPVVLANLWVADKELSKAIFFAGVIIGPFVVLALLFEIVSFFTFRLHLSNDGTLHVKSSVNPQGHPLQIQVNIRKITDVTLEPVSGMPLGLYEGSKLLAMWSTKPMSLANVKTFLRKLKEINPAVRFNDYAAEIVERGTTRKITHAFSGKLWPLLSGLTVLLYLPTVELLLVKVSLGQLTWVQKSLQDLCYLSLIPLTVSILTIVFFQETKMWLLHVLLQGLLTFLISLFVTPSAKPLLGIVFAIALVSLVFFLRPQTWVAKGLRVLLAGSFAIVALVLHIQALRDFMAAPVLIQEARAVVDKMVRTKDGERFTFHLEGVPSRQWKFSTFGKFPAQRVLSSGELIRLYYAPHLGTLLKVENAVTGSTLYLR